ncbi:MAG: hypothetical protein ACLFQQ_12600 [Desulfococcaceae bacterium]
MSHWMMTAAFLSVLLLAVPVRGAEPNYHFSHDETRYRFEGSFQIQARADCLLKILFEFEHLKNYVAHTESATLDEAGENWQKVTYQYRNLFYKARSTFRRTLNPTKNRVEYELTRLDEGGIIRPEIRSISGYYGVSDEGMVRRVTFFQEGELAGGMLSGIYFNSAKKVAVGFLREIARYAESHCP